MNKIDIKILHVLEVLKSTDVRFENEFCDKVGVLRQTLYRIKKGVAHFTPEQIGNVCKVYNINAHWVFGIEPNMYRVEKKKAIPAKSK